MITHTFLKQISSETVIPVEIKAFLSFSVPFPCSFGRRGDHVGQGILRLASQRCQCRFAGLLRSTNKRRGGSLCWGEVWGSQSVEKCAGCAIVSQPLVVFWQIYGPFSFLQRKSQAALSKVWDRRHWKGKVKTRSICGLRVMLAERWNGVMERGALTKNDC